MNDHLHNDSTPQNDYRCSVEGCQRVFQEQETLLQHQSRHIQCASCMKRFKTKAKFKNHLRYHASKRCRTKFKQSLTESDTPITKKTNNIEAYACNFYCKTCSFETKHIQSINRHCNFFCQSPPEPSIISNYSRSNRKQSLSTDKSQNCKETGNNDAYTCSYSCISCTFIANSVETIKTHCNFHCDPTTPADHVLVEESTPYTLSINSPSSTSNEDCVFENYIHNATEECQQNMVLRDHCTTCGEEGKNARMYHKHIKNGCKLRAPDTLDLNKVTLLNCVCRDNAVKKILNRLSPADKIDLCIMLKSAVPEIFPFLLKKIKAMGHFKIFPHRNGSLLKLYLLEKPEIVIPKHLIISCEGKKAYFGPDMTKIPNFVLKTYNLSEEEFDCHYVITIKRRINVLQNFNESIVPLHESTQIEDVNMTDDEDSSQDSSGLHSQIGDNQDISLNSSILRNQNRDNVDDIEQSSTLFSQSRYNENDSLNSIALQSLTRENESDSRHSSVFQMQTLDNEVNSQRFSDLLSQTGDNEDNSQRSSILQSETGSNRDISQRDTEDNSQSSNDESSQGEDNVRDNTNDAEDNTNDAEDNTNDAEDNANNAEDNTNNAEDNNNNAEDNTNDTEDNTNDTEDNINDTEDNTNDTEDNQEDESDNTLPREKFKYMNIFLHPEEASSEDINNLIHCTKTQFLEYAESLRPYQSKINRGRQGRKSNLSLYSRAFLFRLKIASNLSFKKLATLFVICKSTALKIYNNILGVSYQFLSSIPNVLKGDEEVEKLYKGAYEAMDPFYKKLFEPFADPKGLGRKPVVFCIDATYQETMKSSDNANNKTFFYSPYHQHVIKLMIICTPEPKVVYVLPACASESPASGDGNLLGNHVRMQAHTEKEALKILAEGTADFFPIFVCDTGFQLTGRVSTPEDRYTDFRQVVEDAGGIFLGTKKEEYLLRRDKTTGEIHKVPFDERLLTAIDTAIKEI